MFPSSFFFFEMEDVPAIELSAENISRAKESTPRYVVMTSRHFRCKTG